MRRGVLVLWLAALLGSAAWLAWHFVPFGDPVDHALLARIPESNTSVVYVLERERWTEFQLPPEYGAVRVVSNANFPLGLSAPPETVWKYALRFQVVDADGRTLQERDYHYRATVTRIRDADGSERTATFYLRERLLPADGKVNILDLAGLRKPALLRVRLASADPAIRDVVFRAYTSETVPERILTHRWQRMSDDNKTELARGNIYPHDFMEEREIRNLLDSKPRPLGPAGVLARSYTARTLYTAKETPGAEVDMPVQPAGLQIDPAIRGTIPLPEGGGQVRLDLSWAGQNRAPDAPVPVTIRWFGRGIRERGVTTLLWHGAGKPLRHSWKGGLLEIEAPVPVAVRAYLKRPDGALEITPEPLYVRTYTSQDKRAVDFPVAHDDTGPTPFRVDFRHPLAPGMDAEEGATLVAYQLLDRAGNIARQGSILTAPAVSRYDRIAVDPTGMRLSDPSSYFFSLPREISRIRFLAQDPVWIAAYNRPRGLVRKTRVPEDAYASDASEQGQPAWFSLRPDAYRELLLNNRSVLLATQYRPPEDNPDILAGRYLWEDYLPAGPSAGRHIPTITEDPAGVREEALPVTYRQLPANRETVVDLRARARLRSVEPSLLYLRASGRPFSISLIVDGDPIFHGSLAGSRGEVTLPALPSGKHRITLQATDAGPFYLNHSPATAASLLKRLAHRLDRGDLVFDYERRVACEETLSLRLFFPAGSARRSRLAAWLEAPPDAIVGPLQGWSFSRREFDVRPDGTASWPVLGSADERVDNGQAFFIPLAADLPPGRYRLRFRLEQGDARYLTLARLTPGSHESRKPMLEEVIRHVENEGQ